jgi:Fe-S-cluster containining protein
MAIEEALQLSDVFPLAAQINVWPTSKDFCFPTDDTDMRKAFLQLRDNAVALGGIQFEIDGVPLVATLCANVLNPPDDHCPALAEDGRCQIYKRRPHMCRAVPFNHELDARLAMRVFNRQHRHDCDWSSTAPVVMRNGQIVDPQYAADRVAANEGQRHDSELLVLLHDHKADATHDGTNISNLIERASRQSNEVRLQFVVLLEMMRGLERIGKLPARYVLPSLADFHRAQIALARRGSSAHDTTAAMVATSAAPGDLRRAPF